MKLITLSDLHIDVRWFKHPFYKDVDSETIVIIPGDVAPLTHYSFRPILADICNHVRFLLFVPGNHEFYGCDVIRDKKILTDMEDDISNFLLLDNKSITIDGVNFIGSTMWTDMNHSDPLSMHVCEYNMNDFWIIKNGRTRLTPEATVEFHNKSIAFIEEELINSQYDSAITTNTNIVITHHAPSYASVIEKYKGDACNAGFASELSELIFKYSIKYWIHGHMHSGLDYILGNTRVVCNPRGYHDKENPTFNPRLELEL